MPLIRRGRYEAKVAIERDGSVVLGVNGERADSDHIGDLKRAPKRIEKQSGTDALALCLGIDCQAREHQERDGMAGHALYDPLWSLRMLNLAGNNRVEADDLVVARSNISL